MCDLPNEGRSRLQCILDCTFQSTPVIVKSESMEPVP